MQFIKMDLRYKQRQYTQWDVYASTIHRDEDNEIRNNDTVIFLCDNCLQHYANYRTNNLPFTRRNLIIPLITVLIATVLCSLTVFKILEPGIFRPIIVCLLLFYGIYCIIKAARINVEDKSGITLQEKWLYTSINKQARDRSILMSLIPCAIAIVLIFVPISIIGGLISFATPILSLFLLYICYTFIRGHRNSKIVPDDLRNAVKHYFSRDEGIHLMENDEY